MKGKDPGIEERKLASMRLHVRAIVRDGTRAFVGSQSLRKDELENRREVGLDHQQPDRGRGKFCRSSRPTGTILVRASRTAPKSRKQQRRRRPPAKGGRRLGRTQVRICAPAVGAFAMNLCQATAFRSATGRSMMPPHHIDPWPGIATHTRFTLAATPKPGTRNVKYGGSADGDAPLISSRTPSVLMSMIFDVTPSIDDISCGTSLRGERRAGRPSASASATDSRNVSRVIGRSIQAASRGTSSMASSGSPTRISGRLAPSSPDDARQVGGGHERDVGDQRFNRPRRQVPSDRSMLSIGTGS